MRSVPLRRAAKPRQLGLKANQPGRGRSRFDRAVARPQIITAREHFQPSARLRRLGQASPHVAGPLLLGLDTSGGREIHRMSMTGRYLRVVSRVIAGILDAPSTNPASQISLFQLNSNAATRADAHRTRTMSLEMCFWMVTDEQLSSFRERPGAFFAFSQSAPSEAGVVDHRNVKAFHYLLNGTKRGASGPLRIFETWFRPCADLVIDDSVGGMPACGIDVADTRALLEHLLALPNTEIRARARSYGEMRARRERLWSWLRRPQIPIVAAEENDYVYLEECFANLREICRFAVVS